MNRTDLEPDPAPDLAPDLAPIRALVFDVFGTVVDWHGGVVREAASLAAEHRLAIDGDRLALQWRAAYRPSMDRVRAGGRGWVDLDVLHRENLDALRPAFGLDGLPEAAIDRLVKAWHRLDPWPDVRPGLARLKAGSIVATLSNGHVALLVALARHGGLPWDCVLSAELFRSYKPDPAVYRGAAALLGLPTTAVMMVAAHADDLQAARAAGLRTAYVPRPREHGDPARFVAAPAEGFDLVAPDFEALAERLGL